MKMFLRVIIMKLYSTVSIYWHCLFGFRCRESASLEYLKNICLKYMLTKSISQRKQMSVTLSTILQFSPNEVMKWSERYFRHFRDQTPRNIIVPRRTNRSHFCFHS